MQPKKLAILGSTGSIGTQALDVVDHHPDKFEVKVLTAGRNATLLVEQARKYSPDTIVIAESDLQDEVAAGVRDLPIKVLSGEDALEAVVEQEELDMVLTALVGFVGLRPTIAAIRKGITIALANKETLVVAGKLITDLAKEHQVEILPVDSEHSALFQCVVGEENNPIEKIYLTASGGPFRGYTREQLSMVTRAQALKHPNWEMGAKITIDSASMMNKGLEVIEAKWLFDLKDDQIDVIVHPQSILHSMVQFEDGSMKAQMGLPDMRLPIQYAMAYPQRIGNPYPRFNFADYPSLTFEQVDQSVFRNLGLAYEAMAKGGVAPCVLNAANEITNLLFRQEKISFLEIAELNEAAMNAIPHISSPQLEDLFGADRAARDWVAREANVIVS